MNNKKIGSMMIEGVAVRLKCGTEIRLPKPNRHCDCLFLANEQGLDSICGGDNQGFYNNKGYYLTRSQAMKHVKELSVDLIPMSCGNINQSKYLFSEDVW